jgi:serine phosphatase RsbU (regulator of sigma subunit)
VLAGHERGVRVRPDGEVTELGNYGTLLGVIAPIVYVDTTSLASGDLVVFYTDGITDTPPHEAMERDELVELLVALRTAPLAEIGRTLRERLDDRRPNGDRDDTALLLLRHL